MGNSTGIELGIVYTYVSSAFIHTGRTIIGLAKLAFKLHLNSKENSFPYLSKRHATHLEILIRC